MAAPSGPQLSSMQKVLMKEGCEFRDHADQLIANGGPEQCRPSSAADGPGDLLGMDKLLANEIDKFSAGEENVTRAVLDRVFIAEKHFGLTYWFRFFWIQYMAGCHGLWIMELGSRVGSSSFHFQNRSAFDLTFGLRAKEHALHQGADGQAAEKDFMRINGVTWSGFQHGSVFCGHLPIPLGAFCYQLDGSRVMVACDVVELLELMGSGAGMAVDSLCQQWGHDPERIVQVPWRCPASLHLRFGLVNFLPFEIRLWIWIWI